jgi:hypothetical protein
VVATRVKEMSKKEMLGRGVERLPSRLARCMSDDGWRTKKERKKRGREKKIRKKEKGEKEEERSKEAKSGASLLSPRCSWGYRSDRTTR